MAFDKCFFMVQVKKTDDIRKKPAVIFLLDLWAFLSAIYAALIAF